ncbi:MAG: hypothetical protein ACL7AX_01100 [Candidatus Arsenophonus phytopathogenicus]
MTQWLDLATPNGDTKVSKPLDLKPEIEQQINQSKQYYDEAKQQGVEIAKRSFFKELLNVGIASVGLGLFDSSYPIYCRINNAITYWFKYYIWFGGC